MPKRAPPGVREQVHHALRVWAENKRAKPWSILGYPRQSVESRLREQGGVLIAGKGLRLDQSDDTAEAVEQVLEQMTDVQRRAVEYRWLWRMKNARAAQELRMNVHLYQRTLDRAYEFLAGGLKGRGLIA